MDKKRFENKVISVLKKTEGVWSHHHKNSTEALRWWFAYTDAQEMVENNNMREWAEIILDGLPPVPSTMKEVINELWDRIDVYEEDEVTGYLQSLEAFYTE